MQFLLTELGAKRARNRRDVVGHENRAQDARISFQFSEQSTSPLGLLHKIRLAIPATDLAISLLARNQQPFL